MTNLLKSLLFLAGALLFKLAGEYFPVLHAFCNSRAGLCFFIVFSAFVIIAVPVLRFRNRRRLLLAKSVPSPEGIVTIKRQEWGIYE